MSTAIQADHAYSVQATEQTFGSGYGIDRGRCGVCLRWGSSARDESGGPGRPNVLGAEAEPLAAGMIKQGVGKLQGEGAEAHEAWPTSRKPLASRP